MSDSLRGNLVAIAGELTRFERARFAVTAIVFVIANRVAMRFGHWVLAWGDKAVARKLRREVNAQPIIHKSENKRVRTLH